MESVARENAGILFARFAAMLAAKGVADCLIRGFRDEATRVFLEQESRHEAFRREAHRRVAVADDMAAMGVQKLAAAQRLQAEAEVRARRAEAACRFEANAHDGTRATLQWWEAGCPDPIPVADTARCPACDRENLIQGPVGASGCQCLHCGGSFDLRSRRMDLHRLVPVLAGVFAFFFFTVVGTLMAGAGLCYMDYEARANEWQRKEQHTSRA